MVNTTTPAMINRIPTILPAHILSFQIRTEITDMAAAHTPEQMAYALLSGMTFNDSEMTKLSIGRWTFQSLALPTDSKSCMIQG